MTQFLEVGLTGAAGARERFELIGARALDFRPAFVEVSAILRRAAEEQFDTQGAYGGTKWQELRPTTLERRRRAGSSGSKILEASGLLRRSLTEPGGEGHVQRSTRYTLRWGTKDPAGAILARYRGRRHPRVALAVTATDRRLIVHAIQHQLMVGR